MPDRGPSDRRIGFVLVLSILVNVLVILGTPAIISTSNATAEVQKGNDIAACRSAAASTVTAARTELDLSNAHLNVLNSQVIQAAVEQQQDVALEFTSQLPDARQDVVAAEVGLDAAINRYRELLELSRDDPDAFLGLCE